MNVTTRILEVEGNNGKGYHPFQVLFARMGITLILSSLYVWWKKVEHAPLGQKDVRWLLALRGFGGFFGVFGMYYSLLYLPLSDATVITFLAPSLACFACSILIKEPFTRMEQIAALISLLGVVLIARPTSLFSTTAPAPSPLPSNSTTTTPPPSTTPHPTVTPSQRALAVATALLGVLGAATAYTTLRWIGRRAHALISVNYFAAWCTLVSVVAMSALPSVPFAVPADPSDWALLCLLGVCGFVMQYLLAAGLQQERSSRATNMVYCQMLFALAADKLVFGAGPDAWGWAGSSLILGSAVYVAVRKERGVEGGRKGKGRDEERGLVEGMERGEESDCEDVGMEEGAVRLEAVRA
ncbi:Drug/metabolite transporter [Neofusicoccum parvum]|uniref:Drug/metabolite transporter n=1 Tax=Neofusicoccum parvum TaxID=310453 RepID=A0ACB5SNC8_9PEZI|nr:Drug/metabolite transporter [Neofusicoccum parvum]